VRPARPLVVAAAFGLATALTVLCVGGCSADSKGVDPSPTSSVSLTADALKAEPSASPSPSESPSASAAPSKTPESTPTRRAQTASSHVGGSGGSTGGGGSSTTAGGTRGGSGTVPQNPNRGPTPPPAPPRPAPTPEWSSGAWQPGDPVETTAPVMTPGQG